MMTHACLMAVLIGASFGGVAEPPSSDVADLLTSTNHVLVDIEQLYVVVAMGEAGRIEQFVDAEKLKSRIVQKLVQGGIAPLEGETELTPRLVAHIEGMAVPDSDRYVCRVQISVHRLVTLCGRPGRREQAEVWHLRPVMEVVAGAEVQETITKAVLTQTEVFMGVCDGARSLRNWFPVPSEGMLNSVTPHPQDLQTMTGYCFVASRNSSVFHRSDCRWAQNISEGNRLGYENRDQAVGAGKRPCKTCKP